LGGPVSGVSASRRLTCALGMVGTDEAAAVGVISVVDNVLREADPVFTGAGVDANGELGDRVSAVDGASAEASFTAATEPPGAEVVGTLFSAAAEVLGAEVVGTVFTAVAKVLGAEVVRTLLTAAAGVLGAEVVGESVGDLAECAATSPLSRGILRRWAVSSISILDETLFFLALANLSGLLALRFEPNSVMFVSESSLSVLDPSSTAPASLPLPYMVFFNQPRKYRPRKALAFQWLAQRLKTG
jgi:ABC-type cobalt transport system substrate-binding protein